MQSWKRAAALLAVAGMLSTAASAYYHFVHYAGRTAPFTPIPEKFDLSALPNKTVQYFVSDRAPALGPNDSFPAVVSQIRLAAAVWDGVSSSDLRLAFGGIGLQQTPQTAPGIDILFEEQPPGVLAQGGPASRGDLQASLAAGTFVPITRSKLILSKDFTSRPSYSEDFFSTLVHEMGHTLGLQHTFTSSVMSIYRTRSVSKAKPLGADDIAGLSILYPVAGWNAKLGTISGRVSLSGTGVNLASVVAIQPNGVAISALTQPDGTYTIQGLPQGNYLVYVHPVPPPLTATEATPGDIYPPLDSTGQAFALSPYFDSQFYPGVRDTLQAFSVAVQSGQDSPGINFNVSRRNTPALYAIETYGYIGDQVTKPPFLNLNAPRSMVATGQGLLQANGSPVAGLNVSVLGGSAFLSSVRPYAGTGFLILDFALNAFSGAEGPRHLVFSVPNDVYVLPSGFQQVQKAPPQIRTATAATDPVTSGRALLLTGVNFQADTRVLFDGQTATLRSVSSDGTQMTVVPPTGNTGLRSVVAALNADGQSSLMIQGSNPTTYTYDAGDTSVFSITPAAIPAGIETAVEITGNGSGLDANTVIGMGSSDVTVRHVWVAGPNRILANVVVSPTATPTTLNVSVASGLQLYPAAANLQIQAANPRLLSLSSQVQNPISGTASVYAGGFATVNFSYPQAVTAAQVTLTLNGTPVPVTGVTSNQVIFVVPAGTPVGPAKLGMTVGTDNALPVVIQIDPAPPVIVGVANSGGAAVDATRPAHTGDVLTLTVTNAGDQATTLSPSRVVVTVGGVDHTPIQVSGSTSGIALVQFMLSAIPASPSVTLSVSIDGRRSTPVPFALAQ